MTMIAVLALMLLGASDNLLANPAFEHGVEGWQTNAPGVTVDAVTLDNRPVVRMAVPATRPAGWPIVFQDIAAKPGQVYDGRVEAMARGITDGYGAYISVEFLDGAGKRISFEQSAAASGDGTWTELSVQAIAPPNAVATRLALIVNGHGEGCFAHAALTAQEGPASAPLDGPVTLEATHEAVCESLIGFGAEDDGWFYNEENAAHGVTQADWAIREGRIEWMKPDWIRMFFWYKDWNPSGDWETFTFDSPNMQSHYRTLDQYQRLGARVNVVGVEWGVPDPYQDPGRVARAVGALMEHLIRDQHYTCVQDWTLTNEPNGFFVGSGYTFERFRDVHQRVKEEFGRRGLKVRILGSDDTNGWSWFQQCVKDDAYFGLSDYFGSHRYIAATSRKLMPFFLEQRQRLLEERTPKKPFIVAEFGFHDTRSGALENPLMKEYAYAIWTSAFVIEGLNRGVAGFSIWCLHEVYYPGNGLMTYGLWDFKENNWKPRPVYHAWAPFSRFTKAGDPVLKCVSSHPAYVSGAVVNATLFWVNQSDKPAEVIVKGLAPKEVRIMTEATLEGDRQCGMVQALDGGRFTAPPMSFGYAQ